jgi:hypothetical protein
MKWHRAPRELIRLAERKQLREWGEQGFAAIQFAWAA